MLAFTETTIPRLISEIEYWRHSLTHNLIPMIAVAAACLALSAILAIISLYNDVPNEPRLHRRRVFVWLREIAFGLKALQYIVISIIAYTHGTKIHMENLMVLLTICISLASDGVNNLHSPRIKFLWFLSYVIEAIRLAISASAKLNANTIVSLSLQLLSVIFTAVEVFLAPTALKYLPLTEEYLANFGTYISFSYINDILIKPALSAKKLEENQIPGLVDDDSSKQIWDRVSSIKSAHPKWSLARVIFEVVYYEWLSQALFQFIQSSLVVVAPFALERILATLSDTYDPNHVEDPIYPHHINPMYVVLFLFCTSLIQSCSIGQNYMRGRHVGVRIRAAVITAIYEKALRSDVLSSNFGVGKINNLISVDVSLIQGFSAYSHLMWSSVLEMVLALTLLHSILGSAAFVGLGIMVSALALGVVLSKFLEYFQEEMLECKDKRMAIVNEILNGIRIIKYFAWEENFLDKLRQSRQNEVRNLKHYAVINVILLTIWGSLPIVVASSSFIVHVYVFGRQLTAAQGYAALTLFNLLRFPLNVFSDMITEIVRARLSMSRIEEFLDSADISGLPRVSDSNGTEASITVQQADLGWNKPLRDKDDKGQKIKKGAFAKAIFDFFDGLFSRSHSSTRNRDYTALAGDGSSEVTEGDASSTAIDVSVHGLHGEDSAIEMSSFESDNIDKTCNDKQLDLVLRGVSLHIKPKSLVVIVGLTGSGKSTLLSGILGECIRFAGNVSLFSKISYAPQTAWIQNATLRDNIVFGSPFNADKYRQVLYSCSLVRDLETLSAGDLTEIGEKGVNLSGGQQQRVSLARAAYSDSDVVIMDDPLSAVDAHVGDHIFNHLITGYLCNRTRILVTHQISLAIPKADMLVVLGARGEVLASCHPSQVEDQLNRVMASGIASENESFLKSIIAATQPNATVSMESQETTKLKMSNIDLAHKDVAGESTSRITKDEGRSVGDVPLSVYWFYLSACGGVWASVFLLGSCLWIALSWVLQNYSLGLWMNDLSAHRSAGATFSFFCLCSLSVIAGTMTRSILQWFLSLVGAQKLHDDLTRRVVLAPMFWFDETPIGRIVNRFSQDISSVDSEVMIHLNDFVDCVLGSLQTILVIAVSIPYLLLPMVPVIAFTAWVTYQYLTVSRELKRLESVYKSPVFVLFSETIQGLPVIRAFEHQERFMNEIHSRIDKMNRCHLYLWLCNRWLNFRMQILGCIVAATVGFAVVYFHNHNATISNTAAGLAFVYSLNFTDYLTFLARTHAECQMNMNSVERIEEYVQIDTEQYTSGSVDCASSVPSEEEASRLVPSSWPMRGQVEFKDIQVKYKSSSTLVLNNVSFVVPSRKKVAVVGRTGAGKSSLVATLFRIVEPLSGEILIDGVNVLSLPLHTLRSRLSIVPQDPTLFEGSVRSNIDPFGQYSDQDIWQVLQRVHMKNAVVEMEGATLGDKKVCEKGSNLSVGQRQLMCLARALLRNSSVLVLDECTANVDRETDGLIQETVRNELKDKTVICIAHRLHTVAFYDLVMVMDKGRVAEMGSPIELIDRSDSQFRAMCQSSGDFDTLREMALSAR